MWEELVLMETKLNLIKKQTKQTPDKTQTLRTLCEWPRTKLIRSYTRALLRRRDEKDKCLKGEIFLCLADIFTQLCAGSKAVQPAFPPLDKSQEVLFFCFFSLSPPFLLWCQVD